MANPYFNSAAVPATGSTGSSSTMRAEFAAVAAGFDKLPAMAGFGNKVVVVNAGGTALTTTGGSLSLPNDLTITGGYALTITLTGATGVTFPTTGTLATLAGTETFTNKTLNLTNNTLAGTIAQFNSACSDADFATLAGTETLTNKTLDLTSNTLAGTIAQFNSACSDADFATLAGTETLTNKTLTSPTVNTPSINTGVLTTSTVAADPSASLGVASKQYVDAHGFSTGDVKLTLKTTADTGWVLMNDGTIGSASSGATTRANTDTSDLYTLIWTNVTDQWAPVTGGRGASAAADFAANKPLALPKTLGRALAGYGVGVVTASGTDADVSTGNDTLTVLSNNTTWITGMAVVLTYTGTLTGSGISSGATLYIIRDSATTVKLATTLANAQNGSAINITGASSLAWTLTHTYTTRVLGETGGQETHAQSSSELLAHAHTTSGGAGGGAQFYKIGDASSPTTSSSAGGNAAMNVMQPTLFLNVMVKL
jgi:hypothetical protein